MVALAHWTRCRERDLHPPCSSSDTAALACTIPRAGPTSPLMTSSASEWTVNASPSGTSRPARMSPRFAWPVDHTAPGSILFAGGVPVRLLGLEPDLMQRGQGLLVGGGIRECFWKCQGRGTLPWMPRPWLVARYRYSKARSGADIVAIQHQTLFQTFTKSFA